MLRKYLQALGAAWYFRKSSRKKEVREWSASLDCFSLIQSDDFNSECKRLSVRIVLAGGQVELYQRPVAASEVLVRYPGMCLARPEVFTRPDESILDPKEILVPGEKFFLVPRTTVRKLKRRNLERNVGALHVPAKVEPVAARTTDGDSDEFFSAKDFFVSKDEWSTWITSRYRKPDKTFTPPIRKPKTVKPLGWKPSLDSIEETSS